MPWSEQRLSTWYSFAAPKVEANQTVLRLFIVHEGQRLPLMQPELADPLRALGVPIETETTQEPASWTCEAFAAEVEAFNAALPLELAGSVFLSARGFGLVETPNRLGAVEHRRRRVLVERFLRERGLAFATDCRVLLSADVCQPLPVRQVVGGERAEA